MGGPIILVRGGEEVTMVTPQIISCYANVGSLSNRSHISISANFGSSEFDSVEFDDSTNFVTTHAAVAEKKPLKKMSSMKKFSTLKKMPSSKVAWEDSASIGSNSLRSTTDKTSRSRSRNESNKNPVQNQNERRRPSFYEDFSKVTTSKVTRSLSKHDEDLDQIIFSQSPDDPEPILAVNEDDLQKIKLLGKGQFCNVHSVAGSLLPQLHPDRGENQSRKRSIYAAKSICPKRVADDDELIIAATDLACEAKILSELDHKNIIKLRGLSCETFSLSFTDGGLGGSLGNRNSSLRSLGFGGKSSSQKSLNRSLKRLGSFNNGGLNRSFKRLSSMKLSKPTNGIEGYFLLLDILTEVLSDRLARERREKERAKQPRKKSQKKQAMYDRIEHIVMSIVDGMRYLHSQDIVLRDLKPGNVGFDEEMNVRLFDFGMARRVSECSAREICGSPRYMAPEIMEGEGYTLKVDVYSFGVLLYELCTLEVPFANSCALMKLKRKKKGYGSWLQSVFMKKARTSRKSKQATDIRDDESSLGGDDTPHSELLQEFYKRVVYDELRPSNNNLDQIIPCPETRTLIQECWHADPNKRPSFDEIATRLEAIFNSQ